MKAKLVASLERDECGENDSSTHNGMARIQLMKTNHMDVNGETNRNANEITPTAVSQNNALWNVYEIKRKNKKKKTMGPAFSRIHIYFRIIITTFGMGVFFSPTMAAAPETSKLVKIVSALFCFFFCFFFLRRLVLILFSRRYGTVNNWANRHFAVWSRPQPGLDLSISVICRVNTTRFDCVRGATSSNQQQIDQDASRLAFFSRCLSFFLLLFGSHFFLLNVYFENKRLITDTNRHQICFFFFNFCRWEVVA